MKKVVICILILFFLPLIYAEEPIIIIEVYNNSRLINDSNFLTGEDDPLFVSAGNISNYSEYANCWTTTEGIKCDVADITYDEISGDISTANQTVWDMLMANLTESANKWDNLDTHEDIPGYEFWYNQSTATFEMHNDIWAATFNATYETFSYNQTEAVLSSHLNTTQMENSGGVINLLESWLTAFVQSVAGVPADANFTSINTTIVRSDVNTSYGIYTNETDIIYGYIEGL